MRILVVGGGSIGRRHISNLQLLGYHQIYCLKRKPDHKFEEQHSVKVITDYSEAENLKIDVIIVCNPTALHLDGLKWGIEHDTAVFMEKPLIHSKQGMLEAYEMLKNSSQLFFIGFMLRFHPLVDEIKSLLSNQAIGEIFHARFEFGSYLPYWHPNEDYKTSYASRTDLGGGVINTITHELDLIQYLFGDPKCVSAIAKNIDQLKIETEEICDALFEYPDKTISLHLDYLQKDYSRFIRILGSEGSIDWNWHDSHISLQKHKQEPQLITLDQKFDVNQLYVDELSHFFKLLKAKINKHDLDGDHALANTKLMLLMHESAASGSKVKV